MDPASDLANYTAAYTGKGEDVLRKEVLHDHDISEMKEVHKEEAMHFAELSEEERIVEKKLLRKVDSLIMPLVILVYLMNYIDRNNYAAAKVQGLEKDLSLNDSEYQTGLSILFVGYVCFNTSSRSRTIADLTNCRC